MKRKTVGASRWPSASHDRRRAVSTFASVTQRAVISSLSAKFSRTTARNSTSSPSRKNRGSAALIRSGFDIFTVCARIAAKLVRFRFADRDDAIGRQVIGRGEFKCDLAVSAGFQTPLPKGERAKFFAHIFYIRDRFFSAVADDESFLRQTALGEFPRRNCGATRSCERKTDFSDKNFRQCSAVANRRASRPASSTANTEQIGVRNRFVLRKSRALHRARSRPASRSRWQDAVRFLVRDPAGDLDFGSGETLERQLDLSPPGLTR